MYVHASENRDAGDRLLGALLVQLMAHVLRHPSLRADTSACTAQQNRSPVDGAVKASETRFEMHKKVNPSPTLHYTEVQ